MQADRRTAFQLYIYDYPTLIIVRPRTGLAKIQISNNLHKSNSCFTNIHMALLYRYLSHSIVGLNITT